MAVYRHNFNVFPLVAALVLFSATAQRVEAGDGPNQITRSDVAAGAWVDSLLAPELGQKPKNSVSPQYARRRNNNQRPALRGKLVNNPDTSDGTPRFALINQRGQILRYVEPTKSIDLERYVGETVGVRRDTGRILLASQLALPPGGNIRLTQAQESLPMGEQLGEASILAEPPAYTEGEVYHDGPVYEDGHVYEDMGPMQIDGGIDFGGCADCGHGVCGCSKGCGFGSRGVLYVRAEYLSWWMEGMDTPPLVIADDNGDFSSPDTIYGDEEILEDSRDGGRFTIGLWLDDYGKWGLEAEYMALETLTEVFQAGGNDGAPGVSDLFIGRPFFNTVEFIDGNGVTVPRGPARQDVDTQRLDGFVTIRSRSEFESFGLRLRHNLCCAEPCCVGCGSTVGCGTGCGSGCGVGGGYALPGPLGNLCRLLKSGVRRTDMLYGIRYTSLEESLHINEDLIVVEAPALPAADDTGTTFIVNDMFDTENEFTGFDLGFINEWQRNRWSVSLLSKVAFGNTNQRVTVSGNTTIDDGGGPVTLDGGLLTQLYEHPDGFVVGNIGTYERDEFSVIPEIGITVGYQLTPRIKLIGGYTLVYWSNVLRPGDQIDIDVNGALIPDIDGVDPDLVVPGDHPRFTFVQDDLWLQGINIGAEVGW